MDDFDDFGLILFSELAHALRALLPVCHSPAPVLAGGVEHKGDQWRAGEQHQNQQPKPQTREYLS
jgi:hypothetical protein